jgi:hypothetical protein
VATPGPPLLPQLTGPAIRGDDAIALAGITACAAPGRSTTRRQATPRHATKESFRTNRFTVRCRHTVADIRQLPIKSGIVVAGIEQIRNNAHAVNS